MTFVDERKAAFDRWIQDGFERASKEELGDRELLDASMAILCSMALAMDIPLSSVRALLDDTYERARSIRLNG